MTYRDGIMRWSDHAASERCPNCWKGWPTPHPGENGVTKGGGVTGLHLLFGDKNAGVGHVHIDYRGLWEGHYKLYNSDVRAIGPQKAGGIPISNYERYKSWFGPIPGYVP